MPRTARGTSASYVAPYRLLVQNPEIAQGSFDRPSIVGRARFLAGPGSRRTQREVVQFLDVRNPARLHHATSPLERELLNLLVDAHGFLRPVSVMVEIVPTQLEEIERKVVALERGGEVLRERSGIMPTGLQIGSQLGS